MIYPTGIRILLITLATVAVPLPPASAVSIVLDDFSSGVNAWRTNDAQTAGQRPSDICAIYTVGRQIDGRIDQAALVEFQEARNTWASVSLAVDGRLWAERGVGQISMWMRGDGSERSVDFTLRSRVGEERRDVSYIYRLPLNSRQWQRRSIRLFAFKDAEGNAPTAEAITNAYLLQFVKTGTWPMLSLYVDELTVEPMPGMEEQPPVVELPLSVRVDFTSAGTRLHGQIGASLGDDLRPVLDEQASSAALGRALEQLTPAVVRLRLSDYWDASEGGYDLIRLNQAINWVSDNGARAMVCLNPALVPAEGGRTTCPDPNFEDVALRLVAMRRGGPHLRYYELFDRPLLTGQFASVVELVGGYNRLSEAVLAADPEARVGGPGFASAWDTNVRSFLEGARTLHFLSLHFYGAHSVTASNSALLGAALHGVTSDLPEQLTLQEVRHLAQSLRRPMPEFFVTSMAMNSARRGDGSAADERIQQPFGAAWMATAALSASPWVDKLLHYRLYDDGWGMLDGRGRPTPAYHAAWLLHTYAPRGATLCQLLQPNDQALIAAVWTATARNVIVIYGGSEPWSVAIDAFGVGTPVLVRERRLLSDGQLQMADLPTAAAQSVTFEGPGISVIQYVGDE